VRNERDGHDEDYERAKARESIEGLGELAIALFFGGIGVACLVAAVRMFTG